MQDNLTCAPAHSVSYQASNRGSITTSSIHARTLSKLQDHTLAGSPSSIVANFVPSPSALPAYLDWWIAHMEKEDTGDDGLVLPPYNRRGQRSVISTRQFCITSSVLPGLESVDKVILS
jgi:hypothetical protein